MIGRPPPMRERYCKGSGAAEHPPVLLTGREREVPRRGVGILILITWSFWSDFLEGIQKRKKSSREFAELKIPSTGGIVGAKCCYLEDMTSCRNVGSSNTSWLRIFFFIFPRGSVSRSREPALLRHIAQSAGKAGALCYMKELFTTHQRASSCFTISSFHCASGDKQIAIKRGFSR